MADYIFLLETRLSQEQQRIVRIMQELARAAGLNLYLAGGPMRDLLTNRSVGYLAFTTEGNPLPLEKRLAGSGAGPISSDAEEQSLRFNLHGVRVRVTAARANRERAGGGTIVEDLRLRGLTLISIGLSLNPASVGLLLDPTNGVADIEARAIRMNHSYVFLEDPATLLRAVRLRARLDFTMEERTQARFDTAREGKYLENAKGTSLGQELEAISYEPDPGAVLKALEKEGLLEEAFGKEMRTAKINMAALDMVPHAVEEWDTVGVTADQGLLALPLILGGFSANEQGRLARMLPSRHLAAGWKKIPQVAEAFATRVLQKNFKSPGLMHEMVKQGPPEAVVFTALSPKLAKAGKKLKEYQTFAQEQRNRIPMGQLRAIDQEAGKGESAAVAEKLYLRMLAGELGTDAELAETVKAEIASRQPKPAASAKPAAGKQPAKAGAKFQKVQGAKAERVPTEAPSKTLIKATPAKAVKAPEAMSAAKPAAKPAAKLEPKKNGAKPSARDAAKPAAASSKSKSPGKAKPQIRKKR